MHAEPAEAGPSFTPAPIPANEDRRLQELRATRLLDSEPEAQFDAIVEAAHRAFNVPIALVSLVDLERQWFKAACGLGATETGRDVSFCGHAIALDKGAFVIEDTLTDERFAGNPLVTGNPDIRFYAGIPIHGPGGAALGTVCLIDREPRRFSKEDEAVLEGFGRWAEAEVLLHATGRDEMSELTGFDTSTDTARAINRSRFWDMGQDMMCIAGQDGFFQDLNDRFTQVLGLTREELLAAPFVQQLHPDDVGPTTDEMAKLAEGLPTVSFRNRYRARDGTYRWFEWSATPVDEVMYATARDVTELVARERMLSDTQKRLKGTNEELQQFTSAVSHDLQEPLRKISAFGERIQGKLGDDVDEKTAFYMERLLLATKRMQALIQSLLSFSRLSSRPPEPRVLDPAIIIAEAEENLEEAIAAAGAVVKAGTIPPIKLDPTHAQQLFQNLIGNAIKYQPEGQQPVVTISGHAENGRVEIEVRDNGIGFEHKYAGQIFKPFQRLHGKDDFAGSGMGLAICQKIVERAGGRITANGDHGAVFRFDLPGVQDG